MVFSQNDDNMIMVYVTCDNIEQAEKIGETVLNKKLSACVNIYKEMEPMFLWPPKSGKIDRSKEVVLIIKSIKSVYPRLEKTIMEVHPSDTPCIIAIPVYAVGDRYFEWLRGEIE